MVRVATICLICTVLISCGGSAPYVTPSSTPGVHAFDRAKIVRNEGDKSAERDILLRFTESGIFVSGKEAALNIEYTIPYDSITKAVYEKSKHLRVGASLLLTPFFLFTRAKKHWFLIYYNTPENKDNFVILRLDKRNYQMILATFETKTGIKVERYEEN